MLFHLSISAQNPENAAKVLAELMDGIVCNFPVKNSKIVFANDQYGTAIEIYPLSIVLVPGAREDQVVFGETNSVPNWSPVHFNLSTHLSIQDVIAIGKREGWRVQPCRRGDSFNVIELWLENRLLIEVMPPDFTPEAIAFHNSKSWNQTIGASTSV